MPQPTPAWTDADTLLLPVPAASWPPPSAPLRLDGIAFLPKRELHVTLVGRALGAALRDAGLRATAASACAGLDWRFVRLTQWLRLEKRAGGRRRHSIIELVDLPAMATLHARLGAMLGRVLPVPPPHVTLYVAGDEQGIGVPDAATLARCTVRRVDPGELGLR